MSQPLEQVDIDDAPAEKLSTPALEQLLRTKYPRDRYALFFDVPDAVSLQQRRRIDALAFGIWQSVGRDIQGFELKVSRSDWLRELKQVDKADPFLAVCDRFWLVTSDSKIAKLEEIPACWGWMAATKSGLRVQRPASDLPGCGDKVPRNFVLGVLRKMQDSLLANPDVQAAIDEQVQRYTGRFEARVEYETRRLHERVAELQKLITDFEKISGIDLNDWRYGNVGEIVKGLRKIGYDGGIDSVSKMLERHSNELRITLKNVDEVRERLSAAQKPLCDEQLETTE